ncbi:MAG: hypothetical protein EOM17_01735 [Synergistales bacterium]|nr:hypothetical protein [Synergistales bacterium]
MIESSDLKSVIATLAGVLSSPHFPKGNLAELKRMKSDTPSLPFWRILFDYIPNVLRSDETMENHWITILNGMAIMAPNIHSNASSHSIGAVFTLLPAQRMNQFLRSKGKGLSDQIRLFARICASKHTPVDWYTLALLLIASGKQSEGKIKRNIAKEYIKESQKKEAVA